MSIDLKQLTPLPWAGVRQFEQPVGGKCVLAHKMTALAVFERESDCDFAALARRAFDVMMRRGWYAVHYLHPENNASQWFVRCREHLLPEHANRFAADPFTALVEADKWMRENVETETTTP